MTIEPEVVHRIVEEIWGDMLAVEVRPGAQFEARPPGREVYAAVQITGGWEGAVVVECTEQAAADFTRAMLGLDDEVPAESDIHDVMGELANMVGGNVKAAVGDDARLSLPTVVVGADLDLAVPGATVAARQTYESGVGGFTVVVMAKAGGVVAVAG
jgi:chemotaxis protein CheX